MKKIMYGLVVLSISSFAFADNGPGCGLGAQVWKGKTGLVAHTSAGTTNGTVSSPLSGLLSGTSGCENPGVVSNEYQQKVFVAMNLDDLAKDAARGSGDHLTSMATLMGIEKIDQQIFFQLTQLKYEHIFSSSAVGYEEVLAGFNNAMLDDARLAQYAVKS